MRPMLTTMAFFALCACQTPMQTGNQCVVEAGFLSAESTFAWRSQEAIDVDDATGYVSPLMQRGLARAVVAELAGKGFDLVESTPGGASETGALAGVEVALTLRTRRELVSMAINESPCVDTDCWERVDMGSSTRMDMRTIGFLAADVFYNGEPIWRGWVERNLYPKDRDEAQAVISEAVPTLFESFPP